MSSVRSVTVTKTTGRIGTKPSGTLRGKVREPEPCVGLLDQVIDIGGAQGMRVPPEPPPHLPLMGQDVGGNPAMPGLIFGGAFQGLPQCLGCTRKGIPCHSARGERLFSPCRPGQPVYPPGTRGRRLRAGFARCAPSMIPTAVGRARSAPRPACTAGVFVPSLAFFCVGSRRPSSVTGFVLDFMFRLLSQRRGKKPPPFIRHCRRAAAHPISGLFDQKWGPAPRKPLAVRHPSPGAERRTSASTTGPAVPESYLNPVLQVCHARKKSNAARFKSR
jgi:hypothetical protein